MLWVPALKALAVHVAVSALPLPTRAIVPQPGMVAPPSENATVPVGAVPVTVAVKVTLTPALDGLAELVRPVVEAALFTTCESAALVDAALPASPAYAATMLCVVALNADVLQVAVRVLPIPPRATAPHPEMVAPPSVKFTAPVGALPVTDAVNVTLAPKVDGLSELATLVVVGGVPLMTWDSVELAEGVFEPSPE